MASTDEIARDLTLKVIDGKNILVPSDGNVAFDAAKTGEQVGALYAAILKGVIKAHDR